MAYSIKEIYYTLQGEGINAGRPAVFLRFTGCNFWNGLDKDRSSSLCTFCDTDFIGTDGPGGARFSTAEEVTTAVVSHWPNTESAPFVVCTGGEPLLQLDETLITALHNKNCKIAIETNGSIKAPKGIDWITVSPKSTNQFVQKSGDELKLVFPSAITPDEINELDFNHFLLSPLWVESAPERIQHLEEVINYCKRNPQWRLSTQQHKYWDIP